VGDQRATLPAGALVAGIELGGSKTVVALGLGDGTVLAEERLPTLDPETTLAQAAATAREQAALLGRGPLAAVGIAAFGPVELRRTAPGWGRLVATPKQRWGGADVAGTLARALGVPVALDTDVNAAALAETLLGAARGCATVAYLTVGTGIGGGVVAAGRLLHGLPHPEIGHLSVPRLTGDTFAGCCPFHGDCLEGLAAGPALAARFGRPAEQLAGAEAEEAARIAAWYLAHGVRNVVYALAPERIVLGGGVAGLPGLVPRVRQQLVAALGGYPGLPEHADPGFVVAAALGGRAGVVGALLLAYFSAYPSYPAAATSSHFSR